MLLCKTKQPKKKAVVVLVADYKGIIIVEVYLLLSLQIPPKTNKFVFLCLSSFSF